MAAAAVTPLEQVALRLRSYADNASSIAFVDVEERHDFEFIRDISIRAETAFAASSNSKTSQPLEIASRDSDQANHAACTAIVLSCLRMLGIPNEAGELAALPFPDPPEPTPSLRSIDENRALQTASLAEASVVGRRPPLAQHHTTPGLDASLRSEHAYRAAVGSNVSGTDARFIDYGKRLDGQLRSWSAHSVLVLKLLARVITFGYETGLSAGVDAHQPDAPAPAGGVALDVVDILTTVVPFCCYVPWSHPGACKEAQAVIAALAYGDLGTSGGHARSHPGNEGARGTVTDASVILACQHADVLLDWCSRSCAEGRWKDGGSCGVQWAALWSVTHIQSPHLTADRLAVWLPLALRFMDDWHPTNVWIGASIIAHLLENAAPTHLRGHASVILQAVGRMQGIAGSHPVLAHVHSYLVALAMPVLVGPSPAFSTKPLLKTLGRQPNAGTGRSTAVDNAADHDAAVTAALGPFDSPYDAVITDVLKGLSFASSSHAQYAILSYLGPVILQCGNHVARHLTTLLPALCTLACNTGDARACCSALHALRCLVITARERFTVCGADVEHLLRTKASGAAIDLKSRRDAVDSILAACIQVVGQARASHYSVPAAAYGEAGDRGNVEGGGGSADVLHAVPGSPTAPGRVDSPAEQRKLAETRKRRTEQNIVLIEGYARSAVRQLTNDSVAGEYLAEVRQQLLAAAATYTGHRNAGDDATEGVVRCLFGPITRREEEAAGAAAAGDRGLAPSSSSSPPTTASISSDPAPVHASGTSSTSFNSTVTEVDQLD